MTARDEDGISFEAMNTSMFGPERPREWRERSPENPRTSLVRGVWNKDSGCARVSFAEVSFRVLLEE